MTATAARTNYPFSIVAIGEGGTTTIPLPKEGALTVGRTPESDVTVADRSVSREHARLHVGAQVEIEDLGSHNGTVVLGRSLKKGERAALPIGSVAELGAAVVLILAGGPSHSALDAAAGPPTVTGNVTGNTVVHDPTMVRLYGLLDLIAPSPLSVLIIGETGTGKEVFAQAVHVRSQRASNKLLKFNCAAIPEALLESELFGHEKGAFTGAHRAKAGLFETADGGTVFLDEIGDIGPAAQSKLLRVLESGEVLRLGSSEVRTVDVRFVSATSRNIHDLMAEGRFRSDLFFRLNGFSVTLPPLRERKSEVASLAQLFLDRAAERAGVGVSRFSSRSLEALRAHDWPGNVRELRNVVERAFVLSRHASRIEVEHLLLSPASPAARNREAPPSSPPRSATSPASERALIVDALGKSGGNQGEAAKLLGMSRRTLIRRIEEYEISRPRKRG